MPCAMVKYVDQQSAASQLHDSIKHFMIRTYAISVYFQSIALPIRLHLENLGLTRLLIDDTQIAIHHLIKHKN